MKIVTYNLVNIAYFDDLLRELRDLALENLFRISHFRYIALNRNAFTNAQLFAPAALLLQMDM